GLDLTDAQRSQAQTIFTQARLDAQTQIRAARDQIHGALTADQLTIVDGLVSAEAAQRPWDQMPIDYVNLPSGLTDSLAFTADQASTIDSTTVALHATLQVSRDQTRTDFRTILTADQLKLILERQVFRLAAPAPQ